jgi:hypothetical protein
MVGFHAALRPCLTRSRQALYLAWAALFFYLLLDDRWKSTRRLAR